MITARNPIDEERLTAYALNEADPAERARIEELLKDNAPAQSMVDEIRATACVLAAELKRERSEVLPVACPRTAAAVQPPLPRSRPPHFFWIAGSLAAAVAIGFFIRPYFETATQQETRLALSSVATNSEIARPLAPDVKPAPVAPRPSVDFTYSENTKSGQNITDEKPITRGMVEPVGITPKSDSVAVTGGSTTSPAPSRAPVLSALPDAAADPLPRPPTGPAPSKALKASSAAADEKKELVLGTKLDPATSGPTTGTPRLKLEGGNGLSHEAAADYAEGLNTGKNPAAPLVSPSPSPAVKNIENFAYAKTSSVETPQNLTKIQPAETAKPVTSSTWEKTLNPARGSEGEAVSLSSSGGVISRLSHGKDHVADKSMSSPTNPSALGIVDQFASATPKNSLPAAAAQPAWSDHLRNNSELNLAEKPVGNVKHGGGIGGGGGGGGIGAGIGDDSLSRERNIRDPRAETAQLERGPGNRSARDIPLDKMTDNKSGEVIYGNYVLPNPLASGSETYTVRPENNFESVRAAPLSTFSSDVDTASYSNVRRFLGQNRLPPPDAVRIEELINYFRYNYAMERTDDPFAVNIESAACPWNTSHRLVRVAVKAHDLARNRRPNSNLVFLIDVSGSMDAPNRLPLVKEGMKSLVRRLGETDRVAIVTYAGESGVALPSTNCSEQDRILGVIDSLHASGGTNGGAGIQTAYATAKSNYVKEGVNRVILATDGDFNVGVTSPDELVRMIENESKSGVFLTALGYGMGNYKDATLQRIADKGHGNYAYIDSAEESRKVLLEQMNATLVSVAKDVKFQVEFNPAHAVEYRLIGYEKRVMPARDFNDDSKDAGAIGAGHTVTAFYEVATANAAVPGGEPLKYQPPPVEPVAPARIQSPELLTVKIRYKQPEGNESKRLEFPFTDKGEGFERATPEFKFATAVALFGQVLKHSQHVGNATMRNVVEWADEARGTDEGGYRREFIQLARKSGELRGER